MISIVIPVFNGGRYINKFYEACTNQIYKDYELVFVDDGSTDDSYSRLCKLKETSPLSIQIIHQENQGVCSARNRGILSAKGDYICFCDIDDEITSHYLSEMLKQYELNDVDLVICKTKFAKELEIINLSNDLCGDYEVKIFNQEDILDQYLFSRLQAGCCTLLLKREFLINNNIFFPTGHKYNEDIYVLWKIFSSAHKTLIMDVPLYIYRQHSESAMSKFNTDRLSGLHLMESLEDHFLERNPKFYKKYKKYGVARIAWSLAWQSAIFLDYYHFKKFVLGNNLKGLSRNLITYPQIKVLLSSVILQLNLRMFRWIAICCKPSRYKGLQTRIGANL